MDTSDPDIIFDENGTCNHCISYDKNSKKYLFSPEVGRDKLNGLIGKIKDEGKNKKYDCIVGVSGGVDSSFVVYKVKELGLRPLAVHLDNGWNSEESVDNIKKMLEKLNIDLYTYVIDWEEFKDLQLSFLRASVADCEIPTDHAIPALLYKVASERGIRNIITGSNVVSEEIMPSAWGYDCTDLKHIRAVHKKFGRIKLKSFPQISLFDYFHYFFIKKIKKVRILNYIPYNREETKRFLEKEFGWKNYGAKHYESVYTRFFQGYILPKKFGFDKRRAHLSSLICSDQITREAALEEMKKDPYPTEEKLMEDRKYVIKKLGLDEEKFRQIMLLPIKTFRDYPSNYRLFKIVKTVMGILRKLRIFYSFR